MTNDTEKPEYRPPRTGRRRGIRLLWRMIRLGVLLAVLGTAFIYLGMSVSNRTIPAPEWMAGRLEGRINESLGQARLTLGRLKLRIDEGMAPRVVMTNVGIFDPRGAEVARLNEVEARFAPAALFSGQFRPDAVRLVGAQIILRRRANGEFDLSFGQGAVTSGTLPGVLDVLDQTFAQPGMDGLGLLTAEELTVTLEDARSGRLWQITDGGVQIRQEKAGLDISVSFDVFNGTEELAEVIIGIRTDKASSSAAVGTTFKNALAGDIALQSPALSFLGVLDAPISGAMRAEFGAEGALQSFAGTLEIGEGVLQPSPGVEPVGFSNAKTYFEFEPKNQKLEFSEIRLNSDTASAVARGQAYLRDFQDGWPSTFLGQFSLTDIEAQPEEYFEDPISFSEGVADIRIRLNPFSVDIGQLVLIEGAKKMVARGQVEARPDGWALSADMTLNQIDDNSLLTLWPVSIIPRTREWLVRNIRTALLHDVKGAIRLRPGMKPVMSVGWSFSDTTLRYIRTQPEIENASGYAMIEGNTLTLNVESGTITAPQGGVIDVAGSVFQVPDVTIKPADATLRLSGRASTTALLSLLDAPPFRILKRTDFSPDISEGRARFSAEIDFPLKPRIEIGDVQFSARGDLEELRSEKLVPGRVLTAQKLELRADNSRVEISGPVRLGKVAADMTWRQDLGPGSAGQSHVSGQVALNEAFVREFRIGLPDGSVSGQGSGRFRLDFAPDRPATFFLGSDLNRLGLKIDAIGWSKPKNATGRLEVRGHLGATPDIEFLELEAADLNAQGGRVRLRDDGRMDVASFERLRVGGWLDAPVVLRGRGPGETPLVETTGGSIDIRKTSFAGATSGGRASGGGPVILALDRVTISEGMALTNFNGQFDTTEGFTGSFSARMNGKAVLAGTLSPAVNGTLIRITSENAGGVLRSAGIVEYANKGRMNLVLRPLKKPGEYSGNLDIAGIKVRNAPGLTDLLAALSIIGLLEQLSGEGIGFDTVKAKFRLTPRAVILQESSAVGPSLGITLEGVYDLTRSRMDMRGVISPVFFLNSVGQVVSRRGEGLFGFNFTLKGGNDAPEVSVNPLSILTPGGLRDLFRTDKPSVPKNGG